MSTKFNKILTVTSDLWLGPNFFIFIFSQFLGNQTVSKLQPPVPLYLAATAT